jgi:hypothetical protein
MTDTTAVSGAPDANEIDLSTISVRDMTSRGYVETATHITYDLHVYVPHDLDDGHTCQALTSDEIANDPPDHPPPHTHALYVIRVTLPKPRSEDNLRLSGLISVGSHVPSLA